MVLANNLKELLGAAGSISGLCRALGLNRTQFNRYLAGEAYPRPDVLQQICRHFGVDARIMLEPLSSLRTTRLSPESRAILSVLLPEGNKPFDHYLFPDGYYQCWRRSFLQPGNYISGLWRVRSEGQIKVVEGWEPYTYPVRTGTKRYSRRLPWRGVIVQSFDGVCMYSRMSQENMVSATFLEFGAPSSSRFIRGISMLARRQISGADRLSPLLAERFVGTRAELLRAARSTGIIRGEDLPPAVRSALEALTLA